MRISDWSSDVCSSDLDHTTGLHVVAELLDLGGAELDLLQRGLGVLVGAAGEAAGHRARLRALRDDERHRALARQLGRYVGGQRHHHALGDVLGRSEEHTSELQSLMRISYAVLCLKQKTIRTNI